MELPDIQETISSTGFWILTICCEILMMVGFKFQSLWGSGTTPILTKIISLLLVPVGAYIAIAYMENR